jgi:hypothetical protein
LGIVVLVAASSVAAADLFHLLKLDGNFFRTDRGDGFERLYNFIIALDKSAVPT